MPARSSRERAPPSPHSPRGFCVTDGHEVSPNSLETHTRRILAEIETRRQVTQRTLAKELGIALGLTNSLIRRVVSKGWVKVVNIKANRVSYLITPAGLAEKARITKAYFDNTARLYSETRDRIRESFDLLSASWNGNGTPGGEKRIVFYGAGEVAEIGFISLQGTDLRLVGVVDDVRQTPFFDFPIHRPEDLRSTELGGVPFDCLVVMSFRKARQIRLKLEAIGFPPERVFWL